MTRIPVPTSAPYDVVVEAGACSRVAEVLQDDVVRVAVIHAPAVAAAATAVAEEVRRSGREVVVHALPDAEAAKDLSVVADCWELLGSHGFTRSDALIAVGGGATTDAVGFVAATWLRGIAVVQVPTTTLAMVDAAVGGKTGINTPSGKNLVGAFHEPSAVLVDLDVLAGLPVEEHRAGLAEVVKAGFIADPTILDLIEGDPSAALDPRSPVVADLLVRSIAVKAAVVSGDLRETSLAPRSREILNYGHTLAHAVERAEDYRWRHGHAVAVGMVFAAEVSRRVAGLTDGEADRHRSVLEALGLPVAYHGTAPWDSLRSAMSIDKKARGHRLRLVLLRSIADPVVTDAPDDALLEAAFAATLTP